MRKNLWWWAVPCALLILLAAGVSQTGHSTRSLSVNGHTGEAIIYQIDGKSYVDIESLVRIANGSMSFKGEQIALSFPADGSTHHEPGSTSAGSPRLSSEFMNSSVQTLAVIKEWTNTLSHLVQRGAPGDGSRMVAFHDRADHALRLTQVAANSDEDRDALRLLTDHFHTVSAWSDKLVGERKRMDTAKYSISEDALKNDDTYKKIVACNKFLSKMLPNGTFHDDRSCH
jgi:hypothetical protein